MAYGEEARLPDEALTSSKRRENHLLKNSTNEHKRCRRTRKEATRNATCGRVTEFSGDSKGARQSSIPSGMGPSSLKTPTHMNLKEPPTSFSLPPNVFMTEMQWLMREAQSKLTLSCDDFESCLEHVTNEFIENCLEKIAVVNMAGLKEICRHNKGKYKGVN